MTKNGKTFATVIVVIVLGLAAFVFLTMPDDRGPVEKIGDAISASEEGLDDAARQLEDRTPAERIGDGIEDATDGNRN